MTDVTPASDEDVEFYRKHGMAIGPVVGAALIARIDAEKAARAEAEAERDALRDRLTLTDEELALVKEADQGVSVVFGRLGAGEGVTLTEEIDARRIADLLAIIDRLTGEATDG